MEECLLHLKGTRISVLVSYPEGVIQRVNCEFGTKGEYGRGSDEGEFVAKMQSLIEPFDEVWTVD
jgi:hypothetical protein